MRKRALLGGRRSFGAQLDVAPRVDNIMTDTPKGPMTWSRAKAIQDKMNSLLSLTQFNLSMDGSLPQADVLCILRYEPYIDTNKVKEVVRDEDDDQEVDGKADEGEKT